MDIGLVAAFLGGSLALLSPCGALLLPAFLASTAGSASRRLAHGAAFYLGLLATLVPLGLGLGALGSVVAIHRREVVVVVSVLLVVLGVAQAAGLGFDLSRLMPGRRGSAPSTARTGLIRTVLLGATGGVAGFCTGPILGAVLTLAVARGDAVSAGVLLAVYGAGMVLPLMALTVGWERLGARRRRVLRGRTVSVLGRQLHTTSLVSGILIAGMGIVFGATNGLVDAPELVSADTQAQLQQGLGRLTGPVVDALAVFAVAAVVLLAWRVTRHRSRPTPSREQPRGPDADRVADRVADRAS